MHLEQILANSPIGKKSAQITTYTPSLLYPIPRKETRGLYNLANRLPFHGTDIWTAYELSWLNLNGKPQVAIAEFHFPCQSENMLEAKSIELYLNSFSQTRFKSSSEVQKTIEKDLGTCAGTSVDVKLIPLAEVNNKIEQFPGTCLDDLDVHIEKYEVEPSYLKTDKNSIDETVYSDLLKSICPVLSHPDWGSLMIKYSGLQIDHKGLLKYLISYRNQKVFFEQCVERIFCDIIEQCKPNKLTVYGRYVRRGGVDANIFRSNFENVPLSIRLARQ